MKQNILKRMKMRKKYLKDFWAAIKLVFRERGLRALDVYIIGLARKFICILRY